MKKIKYLLSAIILAASVVSCNLVEWDDIVSLDVTPTLIKKVPKIYPGGNAECSTVGINGLVQTTGRNNYNPSTDQFESGWPSGLIVQVSDDKSVSFQIDGSINLGDGKCYKVGAVIVKGSNASNLYDYTEINGVQTDGVAMDRGLVAPDNSSGEPAQLSNLTFCFVECQEQTPVVIAVKSWYWLSQNSFDNQVWDDYKYTMSNGTSVFTTGAWCDNLGINYFPGTSTFTLSDDAGTVKVEEAFPGGIASLIITVDLNDGLIFDNTSLYVGSLQGLLDGAKSTDGCPIYSSWPYQSNSKTNTHIFTIPLQ